MKNPFKKLLIGLSLIFSLTSCSGFLPSMRRPRSNSNGQISQTSDATSERSRSTDNKSSSEQSSSVMTNPYGYHIETDTDFSAVKISTQYYYSVFYLTNQYGDHIRLSRDSYVVSNNYQLRIEYTGFLANRYGFEMNYFTDRAGAFSFTLFLFDDNGYGVSETYNLTYVSEEDTYHVEWDKNEFGIFELSTSWSSATCVRIQSDFGNWITLNQAVPYKIVDSNNVVVTNDTVDMNHIFLELLGEQIGPGYLTIELYTPYGQSYVGTIECLVKPSYNVSCSYEDEPYIADGVEKILEFTLCNSLSGSLIPINPDKCCIFETNCTIYRIIEQTTERMVIGITGDGRDDHYWLNVKLVTMDGYEYIGGCGMDSEVRYLANYWLQVPDISSSGNLSKEVTILVANSAGQTKQIKNISYYGAYGLVGFNQLNDLYVDRAVITITASASGHDEVEFQVETIDGFVYSGTWGFGF